MSNRVFIKNLPYSLEIDELEDFFVEHADVKHAKIVKDRATGKSRGFGFITFDSVDDAKECIDKFNGKELKGRPLEIELARPKEDDFKPKDQ